MRRDPLPWGSCAAKPAQADVRPSGSQRVEPEIDGILPSIFIIFIEGIIAPRAPLLL
jgi:hypothetical protein